MNRSEGPNPKKIVEPEKTFTEMGPWNFLSVFPTFAILDTRSGAATSE